MKYRFTLRLWAILLLAAGYGWAGGHFIPGDAPVWAYAFQMGMLGILTVLATGFIKAAAFQGASGDRGVSGGLRESPGRGLSYDRGASSPRLRRNVVGLTIYSVVTLLVNIANIVRGGGQGVHYGSKNSFADLVPIGLIIAGDLLWLSMSMTRRMGRPRGQAA